MPRWYTKNNHELQVTTYCVKGKNIPFNTSSSKEPCEPFVAAKESAS